MKVRSLKFNYVLNAFRVVSAALIGIVTMPYINNVLGAENVGKVEYINTVINYFILFSALGIPMYGIREIAKVRDDVKKRSKTVIELLIILIITSLVSYIILFGVIFNMVVFDGYKDLLLLMSSMILLSNMGVEWYFQGIEDQLYITVRYVVIRIITLFLLFYIVKDRNDYLSYAFILVLTVCGSNIFNMFYLFKTINLEGISFKTLNLKKHLKPILTIFIASISINIYLQLDNFLIGFLAGDKYVGYYSVSNKLIRFVITFITIIGAVLLPRLSNLYETNKDEYNNYLKKAFDIIIILALPFSIYFFLFSESIINLMAGKDFQPSIITMRILSPLCVIVGIAYFLGYLVLYTQNKEKIYTKAVIYSALFSVLLNYFSILYLKQNGAALIAVLSELLAIIIMIFYTRNNMIRLKVLDNNFFKIIISNFMVLGIMYLFIRLYKNEGTLDFMVLSAMFFSMIFFSMIVLKERNTKNSLGFLKNKIR